MGEDAVNDGQEGREDREDGVRCPALDTASHRSADVAPDAVAVTDAHSTEAPGKSMELTRDAFLDGRVMLLQPRRGYRAGIDAVFLAAAAQAQDGRSPLKILDAGAGVGAVGLLAAWRLRSLVEVDVTLLEQSPELVALAERNAQDNGLAGCVHAVCADFLGPVADLEALGVRRESYDLVLTNPPYHVDTRGTRSADAIKAGAHAMGEGDLQRWARALAHLTRPGGEVVLIQKADALPAVLAAMSPRFGGLTVLPLHPRAGEPAIRILVQGTKGSRAPFTLLQGGVLHGNDNDFTPVAKTFLRDGAGFSLRRPPEEFGG